MAEESAGPSLEGLGLASAPGTPVAAAQQAAVPSDSAADGAAAAEPADGRSDAHAAALEAMPPSVVAIVQQHSLLPVPVQVGGMCYMLRAEFADAHPSSGDLTAIHQSGMHTYQAASMLMRMYA
jgi:hypothetical protein